MSSCLGGVTTVGPTFDVEEEDKIELAIKAHEQGVSGGLDDTADFILTRARDYINFKEIYDTGKMSQTAGVDVSKPFEKYVYFVEKHAPFMELGTGPAAEEAQPKYMPPLEPLIKWCKRKGIQFDKDGRTLSYKETAQMIRWHIYHYGIDPRPFLRPAGIEGEHKKGDYIQDNIDREMKEAGFRAGPSIG